MTVRYALHQEDRLFLQYVERTLLALLRRSGNTPTQKEALAALLTGLWNLPEITPGLHCALEYQPSEAGMRFEISGEALIFSYGVDFHATFWREGQGQHVGSRWGESAMRSNDYHSWKVLLEMFETDLSSDDTEFTVEFLRRPSLEIAAGWTALPSWEAKGVRGLTRIEA